MSITVHIKHHAEFSEWLQRYPAFSFLKQTRIPQDEKHRWNTNTDHWGYKDKTTYSVQIMFIGKTGYGKSTTLNRLIGKDVFQTDDVRSCTKDLYTSMYRISASIPSFLEISDLPGVGESSYADNHYYTWYKEMAEMSDVIVYVLRADQRDFSIDKIVLNELAQQNMKKKVILALNYADKIEPINRRQGLSAQQIQALERKRQIVSEIFQIGTDNVLYYSAAENININQLAEKIAAQLKKQLLKK